MKNEMTLSATFPVPPERLFRDWLDSAAHSAITGSPALIDPWVGGQFRTWDGYIYGKTLEMQPGKRILQSWRTTDFSQDAPDSLIEVLFESSADGTLLTIRHTRIPPGQAEEYANGWREFYFEPMQAGYSRKDCMETKAG